MNNIPFKRVFTVLKLILVLIPIIGFCYFWISEISLGKETFPGISPNLYGLLIYSISFSTVMGFMILKIYN
jgi:hypothetical protein